MSDPVRRLGLGTVQFGQGYGISNSRGQVPLAEARDILTAAAWAGMPVLDTAADYGEAEQVLAQCNIGRFRIVSKTINLKDGVEAVIGRAQRSVQTLGRVDVLLVHAVADLLGPDGNQLWNSLRALKDKGAVSAIGISAYVEDDPAALAQRFRPDVMQLPFSLLDQRLLQDGTLARLKELSIEIHARSIFLQGLLFMEEPPQKLRHAVPLLKAVRARIASANATTLSAALGFVLSRPEIDVGLVGVTSRHELDQILEAARMPLADLDWAACAIDDPRILTPFLW